MKIVLGVLAVVILLIGAQSVFAQLGDPHSKNPQAAFQSGYRLSRIFCLTSSERCVRKIFRLGYTFLLFID